MSPIRRMIRKAMGSGEDSSGAGGAAGAGAAMPGGTARSGGPEVAKRFFFINGHPRSGTNWLSALMNLHPQVYCHGEFHFHIMRQALDGFTSLPWYLASQEPVKSEAERALEDLIRRCLAVQGQEKPGAVVLGDHTPRPMRAFLPEAKYLLIRRDGRDVLTSWTYHLVRTGKPEVVQDAVRGVLSGALGPGFAGAKATREQVAEIGKRLLENEQWVRHFAHNWGVQVERDEHAAREWNARGVPGGGGPANSGPGGTGGAVLLIKYEDLHADTEAWRKRAYEFLGVDPALATPVSAESRTAPGFGREDPTSFYRKGEVGDWRNHFSPDAERWFLDEAHGAMAMLGYLPGIGGGHGAAPRSSVSGAGAVAGAGA